MYFESKTRMSTLVPCPLELHLELRRFRSMGKYWNTKYRESALLLCRIYATIAYVRDKAVCRMPYDIWSTGVRIIVNAKHTATSPIGRKRMLWTVLKETQAGKIGVFNPYYSGMFNDDDTDNGRIIFRGTVHAIAKCIQQMVLDLDIIRQTVIGSNITSIIVILHICWSTAWLIVVECHNYDYQPTDRKRVHFR